MVTHKAVTRNMLSHLGPLKLVRLFYHLHRTSIMGIHQVRQMRSLIADYLLHISRNLIRRLCPARVRPIINYLHPNDRQFPRSFYHHRKACASRLVLQQGLWMRLPIWQVNNIGLVLLCLRLRSFSLPLRRSILLLNTHRREATCNGPTSTTTISHLSRYPTHLMAKVRYQHTDSNILVCLLIKVLRQALATACLMAMDRTINHLCLLILHSRDMATAPDTTSSPLFRLLTSEDKSKDLLSSTRPCQMHQVDNDRLSRLQFLHRLRLPDGRMSTLWNLCGSLHLSDPVQER